MKLTLTLFTILLLGCATHAPAAADALSHATPGSVELDGWLGEKMRLCLEQRVMAQDLALIIESYRQRTEENAGHWRCEYWGKWFTSAAWGFAYKPTAGHRAVLERGVSELLATQSPDGYIGTYKPDKHLGIWDVWGRKYTLLGLIADYDLTGSQRALAAARRVADHLLQEAPPGTINLAENGIDVLQGLSSSSILEPFALLYQRTGERRYREFAENIIANWSKPNRFSPHGPKLIEQALAGTPPGKISSRKAYEMMSCFEGLCEMYRVTGNRRYLDASIAFAQSIRRTELMVHGSGSNQELWNGGTRAQTEILEQPVETCVTATWMKLCDQLLRLTGDPLWADELEVSLFNALLGAMTPDGAWWAYFSPLCGERVPSHYQHQDVQLSCCVANGPRGLLLTPQWAVMGSQRGVVVNLYSPGSATHKLPDGTPVKLVQQTTYPVGNEITLTVSPAQKTTFTLSLRIPAWSRNTTLTVNGEPVTAKAGRYCELRRAWASGDKVVLKLDLRGRAVPAPSGAPQLAVMRGPVLLALDDRLVKPQDVAVRLVTDAEGRVELKPSQTKPANVWMAFDAPFEVRPSHYFKHHQIQLALCDYASAGNGWSSGNLFRSWLPQPLFLRNAFPADTWRLTCPDQKECPTIPTATSAIRKSSAAAVAPVATTPGSPPNIILILTDDQGWADLACQGPRKDVRTPNLDALAASGVRFARGYVSAPVCVPSRAGLVTGRYQTRFNIESNDDGPLPASEKTIADRLKQAGYATGMVGKWHLAASHAGNMAAKQAGGDILWGDNVPVTGENLPGKRGFDEYFCGAMRNYAASFDLDGNTLPGAPVLVRDSRFRVDAQTEAALAFLKRQRTKPFFLYLAYFAPHVPLEAPEKYLARFAHVPDPTRRTGLAMIAAVDDGVGHIRQFLRERGLEKNTLIFFLSDNGAPTKPGMWDGSLNEPFVGEKGLLTDGGHRLPFLMSWPGRLPAGRIYEPAVISLDLMTTALAAAQIETRPEWKLDGVNLLPYLTNQRAGVPHEALFWRFRSQAAVLAGRWKLYFIAPDRWLLFDGENPAGERQDVAAQHPGVVAELQAKLRAWCAEQTPPGLPSKPHTEDNVYLKRHHLLEP